jgi:hypothetical protein
MANNKIQFKRTSVSGRTPNTSVSTNNAFIDAGEISFNITDKKAFSSNGTALFEIGGNLSSIQVTGNSVLNGIIANGSIGSAGQVLTSNSTGTYWSTSTTGTVTNIATANGVSGGPITSTGTIGLVVNTGLSVNTSGLFVNTSYINTISANNSSFLGGIVSTGYQTTAGLSANVATLTSNNSTNAFGKTEINLNVNNALTSNNSTYLGGLVSTGYQTTAGLSSNVATLTANNANNLLGRTWAAPGTIGSTTANTGAFTTVNATSVGVGANVNINTTSISVVNTNISTAGITSKMFQSGTSANSTSAFGETVLNTAQYRGNSATITGAIVFSAESTLSTIMHQHHIRGLLHNDSILDFIVQGYRSSGDWINTRKINLGAENVQARFGLTPTGQAAVILGDVDTIWSWPHITIVESLFSHTNINDEYGKNWSASLITDLSSFTNVSTDLTNSAITGNLDSTSLTGLVPYASIPANIVNTTNAFTISGVYTHTANTILRGVIANGSIGSSGQVLTSNATSTYWSTPTTGTVTNIATGNGISGGPITSTGTLNLVPNTGVVVNATGIFVNSAYINTISSNNSSFLGGLVSTGYQTTAGLSANVATLTANNSTYAFGKTEGNLNVNNALTANNSTYLGGLISTGYQTTAGLSANVATLTANNANNLLGRTWVAPGTIGSTTANTGAFTSLSSANLITTTNTVTFGTTAYITSGGNLGVGIASPTSKLHVVGNTHLNGLVSIGTTGSPVAHIKVYIGGNITGSTTAYGLYQDSSVQPDVTGSATGYMNIQQVKQSNTFSTIYRGYRSTVVGQANNFATTTEYTGYLVDTPTSGVATYGFYGALHSNTTATAAYLDITSNVATITTTAGHNLFPGQSVAISGLSVATALNGSSYTIVSTPETNSIRFIANTANVANTADSGTLVVTGTRYNLFMAGTASNYLLGNTGIGGTGSISTHKFSVQGLTYLNGNTSIGGTLDATTGIRVTTAFSANTTRVAFANNVGLIANNSIGTAGQVLTSNASTIYWSTPTTGTVTNIATGNGISGGPITSTGTLNLIANTGVVVNATGIFVNSAYINTISSNNSSFLGGLVSTGYQTTSGLSSNVATLTANNANNLLGRTWVAPGAIGSTTANTGAFTTVTATNISGANAQLNVISATKLYPKAINFDTTNLFPDPELEDANCYSGDTFILTTVAADGGTSKNHLYIASNTDAKNVYSTAFQIEPGAYYKVSAKMEHSGSGSGGPYLYMVTYSDNDATTVIEEHPIFTSTVSTTPAYKSNTVQISTSARRAKLLFHKYAGIGRNAIWSEPRVDKLQTEFNFANVSGNLSVYGTTTLSTANVSGNLSVYGTTTLLGNTEVDYLVANNALGTNGQFLVSNTSGGMYWKTQNEYLTGDLIIEDFSNVDFINTFLTLNAGKTIFVAPGVHYLDVLTNGPDSSYHGNVVNIPSNTALVGLGDVIIKPNDPFRCGLSLIDGDNIKLENITIEFDYGTARHSSDFIYNSDNVNDPDDYWWARDYYANGQLLDSDGNYTGSTATAAPGPFQTWVTEFNTNHYGNTEWKFYNNPAYAVNATPSVGQTIKDLWDDTSFGSPFIGYNAGAYVENCNNVSFIDFYANNCVAQINYQGGNSEVGTSQSSNIYVNTLKMGPDVEFGLLSKKVNLLTVDSVISDVPGINRNHAEPHIIYFSNEPTRAEKSTNINIKSAQIKNYRKGGTIKTKEVYGLTIGSYVASSIQTAFALNGKNISINSITVNDQTWGRIMDDEILPDLTAKYKNPPLYLVVMNDVEDVYIGNITVEQRPAKLNVYYNEQAEIIHPQYLTYDNYSEIESNDDQLRTLDVENGNRITIGSYNIKSSRLSNTPSQIKLRRVINSYVGPGMYLDYGRNYDKDANTQIFDGSSAAVVNTASDYIFITNNPFANGDVLWYSANTGTPIGGLTNVYSYYVINSNTSALRLSTANNGTVVNLTSVGVGTTHILDRYKVTPKLFELSSSTSDGGSADKNTFAAPRLYNAYWGEISSGSSENCINIDPLTISPSYEEGVTIDYLTSYGDNNKINLVGNHRHINVDNDILETVSGEYIDDIQTRDKSKFYLGKYYPSTFGLEESTTEVDHAFKYGDSITVGTRTYTFSNSVSSTDTVLLHEWPFVNTAISNTSAINITSDFFPISKNKKLTDRDIVRYTTTGTAIGGLSNNSYYFITGANTSGVKLANTTHITTPINLTSVGTGIHTLNKNDLVRGENLIKRLAAAISNTQVGGYSQGEIYNNGGTIHPVVDAIGSGVELLVVTRDKGAANPVVSVSSSVANQNILLGPYYGSDGNIINSNGTSLVYGSDIGSWSDSQMTGGGLVDSTQFYSYRQYDTSVANVVVTIPVLSNTDSGAWFNVRKTSSANYLKIKNSDGILLGVLKNEDDQVYIKIDNQNNILLDVSPWWLSTSTSIHFESNVAWNAKSLVLSGDKVTYTIPAGTDAAAIEFKSDGTRAYTVSDGGNLLRSYELGTAWDISTAVVNTNTFDTSTHETNPRGLVWKDDGTRLYITGYGSDKVHEYSATTAWVANSTNLTLIGNVAVSSTSPREIKFSNTGSKMYILNATAPDSLLEYDLSTPWRANTATLVANLNFTGYTQPEGMFFSNSGYKLFVSDKLLNTVDEYILSTPWQVNTAIYTTSAIGQFSNNVTGIYIKPDGTRLYATIGDDATAGQIHQYTFEPLTIDGHKIWTSDNDGSGSGLDADKLGGLTSTGYQTTAGLSANVATLTSNNSTFAFSKTEINLNVNNALTSNNSSFLGGLVSTGYQTTAGLSGNVATLTANNANNLLGRTWVAPGAIGSTTANTGRFTTLDSTGVTTVTAGGAAVRGFLVANGASYVAFTVNASAGSYNPLVLNSENSLIFSNGTSNGGSFFIGPWTSRSTGIRVDGPTSNISLISNNVTILANVNIDAGTFYVDGLNNRVGISNTNPLHILSVNGDGYINGNVIVGNTSTNTVISSSGLSLANSTSNTRLSIPSTAQYSATNVFLHANGSWIAPSAYAYTAPTITVMVNDPNGDSLATGNGQAYIPIPASINNYSLVNVLATVVNASSSGNVSLQFYNVTQNRNILTTELTIDNNEVSSTTSGITAVVNSAASSVLTGDLISIQVNQAGTGVKGLMVNMTYQTVITASSTYTPTITKYVTDPFGDELITGDGQAYIPISPDLNGFKIASAMVTVANSSSSGTPTIQIRNTSTGVDLLTTPITIDVGETSSITAATPPVINTSAVALATGNLLAVDIDVAGTGTKGLILTLTFGL